MLVRALISVSLCKIAVEARNSPSLGGNGRTDLVMAAELVMFNVNNIGQGTEGR